jgi:hypothetical protein
MLTGTGDHAKKLPSLSEQTVRLLLARGPFYFELTVESGCHSASSSLSSRRSLVP